MKPRRKFSPKTYAEIIARQQGICGCGCGEPLGTDPRAWHWEHTIPLWCGGKDEPSNITAMLVKHHAPKTRREAAELAKVRRIEALNGHRVRNLSRDEKELEKLLAPPFPR